MREESLLLKVQGMNDRILQWDRQTRKHIVITMNNDLNVQIGTTTVKCSHFTSMYELWMVLNFWRNV